VKFPFQDRIRNAALTPRKSSVTSELPPAGMLKIRGIYNEIIMMKGIIRAIIADSPNNEVLNVRFAAA